MLLRLERLPSAGGPVARALAVLGEHDVTLKDVATLAGVPEDAAADALAELERSGLVTGHAAAPLRSTRSCAPRSRTTCRPWSAPARTSRRR